MVQPQASGTARQLVDQTIPIVQQHLADAQTIWRQVGGGMNNGRNGGMNNGGTNNGSSSGTSTPGTSTPGSSNP
jgi:hypothetical protein